MLLIPGAQAQQKEKAQGPAMNDQQFIESLDLEQPALAAVKQAATAKDWAAAKRAFAAYLKSRTKPRWYFGSGDKPKLGDKSKPSAAPKSSGRSASANPTDADRYVRNDLPSVGFWHDFKDKIDWNANPTPNNYNEWTWQLNRHPFWAKLGRVYWDTGDEKYAQAFVRQMSDWVRSQPPPADSGNRARSAWRTIETGIRMFSSWPESFYYFIGSPSFDDEAMTLMVKSFADHARHLMKHPTSGNWLAMEANGLFHAGALFPEFREAALWRKTAMDRLFTELDHQVYADGAQIELAPGYHNVSLSSFEEPIALARLNDYPFPDGYIAKLERMYDYDLFISDPNRHMPPMNDSGEFDIVRSMATGLKYFPARKDFQWIVTGGKEGAPPEHLSHAFPYAGYYAMRSGWDSQARYLMLDAGPFGYGHQHEDKLTFVAAAYGKTHVTEGGVYAYDTSKWRAYVLDTFAHNTVLVDGLPQRRRGAADRWEYVVKTPQPHEWVLNEDWEYAAGVYDEGYGKRDDRRAKHWRHVVFVKSGANRASKAPGDYWIVADVLTPRDSIAHTYDAMFHLNADAIEIAPETARVITKNQKGPNFAIVPLMQPGLTVRDHKGEESPQVQGWTSQGSSAVSGVRAIPTPIFDLKASGEARFVFILYPIPEGQSLPVTAVSAVPVTQGKAVAVDVAFGAQARDRIILPLEKNNPIEAGSERYDGRGLILKGLKQ